MFFCALVSDLEMTVESMKTGAANGIPVVFVLDDFELFTYRKPQTLLYALLDLCQASKSASRRKARFEGRAWWPVSPTRGYHERSSTGSKPCRVAY